MDHGGTNKEESATRDMILCEKEVKSFACIAGRTWSGCTYTGCLVTTPL